MRARIDVVGRGTARCVCFSLPLVCLLLGPTCEPEHLPPLPSPPSPPLWTEVLVLAYLDKEDGAEFKTFAEVANALRNGEPGGGRGRRAGKPPFPSESEIGSCSPASFPASHLSPSASQTPLPPLNPPSLFPAPPPSNPQTSILPTSPTTRWWRSARPTARAPSSSCTRRARRSSRGGWAALGTEEDEMGGGAVAPRLAYLAWHL